VPTSIIFCIDHVPPENRLGRGGTQQQHRRKNMGTYISQSLVDGKLGMTLYNTTFLLWTRDDDASLDGNLLPCKQRNRDNLYNQGLSCMHLEDKSQGWSKLQDQAIFGDMHFWCMSCGHGALLCPPSYERIEYLYVFMLVLLTFLCSHAD